MSFADFFKRVFGPAPPPTPPKPEPPEISSAPPIPPEENTTGQPPAALTATPASKGRVLLIHGYSADGAALIPWRNELIAAGQVTQTIAVGNYITLNNEVTLKDLGEAFDRALRKTKWSPGSEEDGKDDLWTFDAIVHSTGMLVLRQWLTSDPFPTGDPRSRIRRLKHLVGLAPATFGSPQAKQGRSWLGSLVKGNKHLGPDFMNAGNRVLDGLELASSYNWDLTHKDLIRKDPLYDKGPNTPYITIFIGNTPYEWLEAVANSPGTDGTVRWAGCSLDTRKVTIDFRREPKLKDENGDPLDDANGDPARYCITPWESSRLGAPMIAVDGRTHGTIVSNPHPKVVELVGRFLEIQDEAGYVTWQTEAEVFGRTGLPKMDEASTDGDFGGAGWQQLIVHVVDDHGDGVTDFNLQLYFGDDLSQSDPREDGPPLVAPVPLIADTYSGDGSYRCFYIRLSNEMLSLNQPDGKADQKLWIELIASSGSKLIEYEAYTTPYGPPQRLTVDREDLAPVKLDITGLAQQQHRLLYPYTTTLLEIFVEREPVPLGDVTDLFRFL